MCVDIVLDVDSVMHLPILYYTQNFCKKFKLHLEKYFVESTKFWFVQQSISFKYGSMEILFELTTKILLIFFSIKTKKELYRQQNKIIAN